MKQKFNFDEALAALQSGQAMSGKDGILALSICTLMEPLHLHLNGATLQGIYQV